MLKILTFNWHEPYLCLLAKTNHDFFVFEPQLTADIHRKWDYRFRPLPGNMKLVPEREMLEKLDAGFFDLLVCQNIKDFFLATKWPGIPKILVFHNRLSTELALGGNTIEKNSYLSQFKPVFSQIYPVFISESKRADWGLPGDVILPGIPLEEYGGYVGNEAAILRVGNRIMERDLMMGYSAQEKICSGLPSVVLGDNPAIPSSRQSESWDDLKAHFRKCRAYLNTLAHPYEDGYNLAMLEAMATGMPVLSLANPTSPLTNGEDGFLDSDPAKLRFSAKLLLENRSLAVEMGERARKTVEKKFPMADFVSRWNNAINNAVEGKSVARAAGRPGPAKKANVWMDYAYYPATTAHYLRRGFAEKFNVVTSGPSMPREVVKLWKLENMKAPILPQDVPRAVAPDAPSILARMPAGFEPDFLLWVETGLDSPPQGMERLDLPKAAYLIDTHMHFENHVRIAKMFDCVFLAQRAYIKDFNDAGIKNVFWLPLGCDPRIHGRRKTKKKYDVGFAGSISDDSHQRRNVLLGKLKGRFDVHAERLFLEEMAEMYSASRLVFNNAIKNDLNMRVFEGLCSGSMLLTDDADGLTDFFRDGRHLAIYDDGNIVEKADYYLKHDAEREKIARAGMELALERHTYLHRAEEIASRMSSLFGAARSRPGGRTQAAGARDGYFKNERLEVVALVPHDAARVLEIGCASGVMGGALKRQNPNREVVGLEYDKKAAAEATDVLDKVFCADVERFWPPYPEKYFDCIIYADVLEHIRDPLATLKRHKRFLAPQGVMVMSIPNVRHFSVVQGLLEGRWKYQAEGLLDRTHLRFFTLAEIKELLDEAGLDAISIQGKRVDDIYREGAHGTLNLGRARVEGLSADEMAEFFFFQYLVVAAPKKISAEGEDDPSHPEFFRRLVALAAPDAAADDSKLEELADRSNADAKSRLLAAHCRMALGRFEQAEKTYKEIGAAEYEACALAARGLTLEALKKWGSARDNAQASEWFDRFRRGEGSPETAALNALGPLPAPSGGRARTGITSSAVCRIKQEDDPAGALVALRNALPEGGVLSVYFLEGAPEAEYPPPRHLFSADGIKRLLGLVGGFGDVAIIELLPGISGMAVCHKGVGRPPVDFERAVKKRLAHGPLKKSLYYWDKSMYEAAEQSAAAALLLDPENPDALSKLADCMLMKGDVGGAQKLYSRGMKDESSPAPFVGMGALCLMRGDFKGARGFFETAAALGPEDCEALAGLGLTLVNLNEREKGMELCKKAVSLGRDSAEAISMLARAYCVIGDFADAERELARYLDFHPANLNILLALAEVRIGGGKRAEAREALDNILLFDPAHKGAVALLKELDRR